MKTAVPRRRPLSTGGTALEQISTASASRAQTGSQGSRRSKKAPSSFKKRDQGRRARQETGDAFNLNSLVVQVWFAQLHHYTAEQYVARVADKERPLLQTGHAWRSFSQLFEPLPAIELVRLFENLLRFANYEGFAPARAFFLAYAPLVFEHDASSEYIGPGVWTREAGSKDAALRVRHTLERWCDWLEALAHFRIHALRYPGPGHQLRDKTIIFLWPLLKRYNWSYRELLTLVRSLLDCADTYPCQSDHQLAAYCSTVLGLRQAGLTTAPKDRALPGQAVAERLFKFLPVFR